MLDKLGGVFAPKPSPGPHKQRECLPLCLILRNRLKYALTYKEVTTILQQRLVKVDGKTRRDKCYPTGIMDVVSIDKTDEHFRIIYDQKGRFVVHRITALEAQVRTRAASARVFFGAGGRAAHACGFFRLGRVSMQRSVARCASEFRDDGIAVGATGSGVSRVLIPALRFQDGWGIAADARAAPPIRRIVGTLMFSDGRASLREVTPRAPSLPLSHVPDCVFVHP